MVNMSNTKKEKRDAIWRETNVKIGMTEISWGVLSGLHILPKPKKEAVIFLPTNWNTPAIQKRDRKRAFIGLQFHSLDPEDVKDIFDRVNVGDALFHIPESFYG